MEKKQNILWKYIIKYKTKYLIGVVAVVVIDYIQLIIPLIIRDITNGLTDKSLDENTLFSKLFLILIIGLSISVLRYMWRYFIFGTSRIIEDDIRKDFYSHLQKMTQSFFNKNKTGDLMAYETNDIGAIRMMTGPGILMGLDALLLTVFTIFQMMTQISVKLTLFSIMPLPFIAIGSLLLGREMRKRFKEKQEAFAYMSDIVQENISGIRVIKAFVQEGFESFEFAKVNKKNYEKNMKVVMLYALMFPMAMFISGVSITAVLGYGGYLTILGQLSIGEFVAFIQYLLVLVWPMIAFGWCINIMSQGSASLSRLQELFDIEPDIFDDTEHIEFDKTMQGEISLNKLDFAYSVEGEKVLKNLEAVIKKGETIGIVGKTGSGKTTLANLLLRLYNPPKGSVYLDGRDILDIPVAELRNSIAYVPQDNFLFSDTILNNIAFINPDTDKEIIYEVAKKAEVHEEVLEFPKGYQTIIGEKGVTLSGGQRQRISIARAFAKQAPILILDDALSAIDTKTEEALLGNLKEIRKGKTTIVISHRISTIQGMDKIIVMDQGEIKEIGKHEELLMLEGLYYEITQKQMLEKELLDKD